MIDYQSLKKIDSKEMHKTYDKWSEIAFEADKKPVKKIKFEKTSHLVFAGMGGSGAIGDIFSAILSKTKIHVTVVKGFNLPKTVNRKSIVIITSVSGNTQESISILEKSIQVGSKIIVFSDGGKIKEICEKNKIIHINVEKVHSPRASLTAFLYSMLSVMKPILPIKQNEIVESINELKKIGKKIDSTNISKSNKAIEISEWIEMTPIIYFPFGLQSAAIRFKNSIQENCKMHVIAEDVIEACHNGVVSWEKPSCFQPILLRGADDGEKTIQLWNVLKKFLRKNKIEFLEVQSVKGNILTKLVCLIYLLDYASIYLSIKHNVDPTPVKAIDFIKKNL